MIKKKALFLVLCGIFVFSASFNCSDNEKKRDFLRDSGNKMKVVKKSEKPNLSYHLLDELSFTAIPPDEHSIVFVTIRVSLAYPYNNYDHENEILVKRYRINKFIRDYISEKTYGELNEGYKRKEIEGKLKSQINSMMKYPISHLYFSKFSVLKRPNPNL